MQGVNAAPAPLITREMLPVVGVALAAAVCFGALTEARTDQAVIGLAAFAAVVIALGAPFATVTVLLFVTVLVPFSVQNNIAVGGGTGEPGLLIIDLLLAVALARVSVNHLRHGTPNAALVAYGVLALAGLQLLHGLAAGADTVEAATELRRVAMAAGGFLLALPVVGSSSRRLPVVLLVLGLALGASGLAQWFLGVEYNDSDFGVREGVGLTSAGTGQLQGGLFSYPVAVILSFAALVSGHLRGDLPRLMTALVFAANLLCLIFTYERTFWGATVVGCVFVLARLRASTRWRALVWVSPVLAAILIALAAAAPGELKTAFERGTSVSQAGTDTSVESRQLESEGVLEEIHARPIHGSGFGARFAWTEVGQDDPEETTFVHNGYLWLSWKTGLPLMLLCVGLILASIGRRQGPGPDRFIGVLRIGAQACLLGLLIINVTFPSFNSLSSTALMGVLLALCWIPNRAMQRARPASV